MGRNYRAAVCVWRDRWALALILSLSSFSHVATIAPFSFQPAPGASPAAETTLEVAAMFVPLFAPA